MSLRGKLVQQRLYLGGICVLLDRCINVNLVIRSLRCGIGINRCLVCGDVLLRGAFKGLEGRYSVVIGLLLLCGWNTAYRGRNFSGISRCRQDIGVFGWGEAGEEGCTCRLYHSDAADERHSLELG